MLEIKINTIQCRTTSAILAFFVSVTVMYEHVPYRYSSCALKLFFAVRCEQISTGVVFD